MCKYSYQLLTEKLRNTKNSRKKLHTLLIIHTIVFVDYERHDDSNSNESNKVVLVAVARQGKIDIIMAARKTRREKKRKM
jgi:hypothetical protein